MERERIKPITLTDTNTDKVYTLEFNRETIVQAEDSGFDISAATRKPLKSFETLWCYAFKMHHPEVTPKEAKAILDQVGEITEALSNRLYELYQAGANNLRVENPTVAVTL